MYPTLPRPDSRRQLVRWWGWLVLGTVVLACLIAIRYFLVANIESSASLLLFRGAMLISHFALLSSVLLLPLLIVIALVPRPKVVIPMGVAWVALILCGLLFDTQVFHLYRFHINAGVLNLLFGGAALETFVFPPEMYLQAATLLAGLLAVVSTIAWAGWRYVERGPPKRFAHLAVFAAVGVCTLSFHAVHMWADAVAKEAVVEQTEVLPFRYAATAKRALRRLGFEVRPRAQIEVAHQDDAGLAYPLKPLACAENGVSPNIIFIMIDSWRFDAISAMVTPNIEAFSSRTVRFQNHYSGGNATRIGVFSMFYSIPGTYWHRVLAEQQPPVFMEELQRRNYEIAVLRSAPLYSPEFDRTIFAGVKDVRLRSQGQRPFQWDRDLTADFEQFLNERESDKPFFAFLFYDSPHSFDMPKDYDTPFVPNGPRVNYFDLHGLKDSRPFVNRYLNSVHYVDSLIGRALKQIEQRGLLENSVIVITGDHGQEFNDSKQDYWGHGSNFTRYQTGVPFLIYSPDLKPAVISHRTSHFDVVPTLMHRYLECSTPMPDYSVGTSLFTAGGRDVLLMSEYKDFAIVQPNLMAVVRQHGMDIFNAENVELEDEDLSMQVIATALEQKRRFYGMTKAAGE